jgi:hypothetical protein
LADSLLARLLSTTPHDRELSSDAVSKVREREQVLVKEFARRAPHIPLVQHRSGQDDSVLRAARFADLEARPGRVIASHRPNVTYVELTFRYRTRCGMVHELDTGRTRVYARIEDPLHFGRQSHSVEHVRARPEQRQSYFRNVFSLLHAQSQCNRELAQWLGSFLVVGGGGNERDFVATIQNFDHNISLGESQPDCDRQRFRQALYDFDFRQQTPSSGPVALRLSVRPHQRPDGTHGQSITTLLLGTRRGIALRRPGGKLSLLAPGRPFEQHFRRFLDDASRDRLSSLDRTSYRKTAEERIWGARGECAAYFHNHDHFIMKGLEWRLERESDHAPKVLGSHRNVAIYRSGPRRVAVKAVPFESAGDLVRLIQAHQYVHAVQAPALMAQARMHPSIAGEILASATSMLGERDNVCFAEAKDTWKLLARDTSHLFRRSIGPLLHQVTVDYEHKLLLTVLEWSAEGMLSDAAARKRLLEDCSLSHRLRMAANLLRNGHRLLEDDVTHTDLKPENILNLPGAAFRAQQKSRLKGWDSLDDADLRDLAIGEPILEGDFSGIHFGREGGIDNLAPGEGLPTSLHYSSWRFTGLGLGEGTVPSVLRHERGQQAQPPIDALVLEQDIANRGTTAWEIVYGTLVDCVPPDEADRRVKARRVAEQKVATALDRAVRLKRRGEEDPAVLGELDLAVQQCDRRLLDLVCLRSEAIDGKRRLTPLFQHARDNRHGISVWLDTRVIDMLDHLACDFRRQDINRHQVAKLYRTAEALLRAEAGRLESADRHIARNRRLRMVHYMNVRRLHFNADSGLLGMSELPTQLSRAAELVQRMPDPRRALAEFGNACQRARTWGAGAFDALVELHEAQAGEQDTTSDRGRKELLELVHSTLMEEHRRRVRLESRAAEERIRPPFLGLLERRRPRVHEADDDTQLGHVLDT